MSVHGKPGLEFFRPNHGRDEIRAEREGNDSQNEIFHKMLLKLFAAARIKRESGEEQNRQSDIHNVQHNRI